MRQFLKCTRGSAAAEYALILAVLGVAIGGSSLALAGQISASIVSTAQAIDGTDGG